MQIYIYIYIYIKYIKLGFTPRKSEQPLQSMELQENEAQKNEIIQEISSERIYS